MKIDSNSEHKTPRRATSNLLKSGSTANQIIYKKVS